MIKFETHAHSFGTSTCADCPLDRAVEIFKEHGYGGVAIINHISRHSFKYMGGSTYKENCDLFFEYYRKTKERFNASGIKTLFGAEVRAVLDDKNTVEYAIIGLDEKYFYEKPLFDCTQKELFNIAEKNHAFMYQTHPFRTGVFSGDPRYMHGAEAFNGHYHHINNNDLANKFCEENNLIKMSGSDFHHADQPLTGGIYLPEYVDDEKKYAEFLLAGKFELICEKETYLDRLNLFRREKND